MSNYEYDLEFEQDDDGVDARQNPDAADAAAKQAFSSVGEPPQIDPPSDDCFVRLPGGLLRDGDVVRDAEVQELTGEHEEALAKARGNPIRFVSTLLRSGVVSIGDEKATPQALKDLLVGDRDTLVLGIRRATFGNDVEFEDFVCPGCREHLDITLHLEDIPIRELDGEREFEVPLRKGGKAHVRLPNGHDQEKVFANPDLTDAEHNTILLAQVVSAVEAPDGTITRVSGDKHVKRLGIADRRSILDAISERNPGPRYDDVKFTHESCETEVELPLSVATLFLGL